MRSIAGTATRKERTAGQKKGEDQGSGSFDKEMIRFLENLEMDPAYHTAPDDECGRLMEH